MVRHDETNVTRSTLVPRPALLGVVLAGWLVSCAGSPEIRVRNETGTDVSSLVVSTPSQKETFGPLPAGQSTEYRPFVRAYRYAAGTYVVGGVEHKIEVIDYVGEEELGGGQHDYILREATLGLP